MPPNRWTAVTVSRRQLVALAPHAEEKLAVLIDPDQPEVRYLSRYLDLVLGPDGFAAEPRLNEHIGLTLVDLISLLLGPHQDAAEVARRRGLRTARQQAIVAEIKASYTDPSLSPQSVGAKLKLSPRYIQDLMQETGQTFTERVMELRLQRARSLLASSQHDAKKVIEIAQTSGFNDLSHFNRCFRRRFGGAPTTFRTKLP